jgi:DNA-binding IclR family transcriptional regulator
MERLIDLEIANANAAGQPVKKKPARQEIEKMLAEVRQHGMARSIGEPTAGIHALSAPVFDHQGNITLAVTVIGPAGTLDASWNSDAAKQVRQCAERISARMGYRR